MTQRTQGEWRTNEYTDRVYVPVGKSGAKIICTVSEVGLSRVEAHDNALLISAAPDLLAACKALLSGEVYDNTIDRQTAILMALAAIAKAEPQAAPIKPHTFRGADFDMFPNGPPDEPKDEPKQESCSICQQPDCDGECKEWTELSEPNTTSSPSDTQQEASR